MPKIAFSYARFSNPTQAIGHSEERQIEAARAYAREHGFVLNESIAVDKGKSAFTGKNIAEGALGEFLRRVESKEIRDCSALLVENPDRVSRQRFSEAYPTYQRILAAGIEIHFLSIRDVLKPNHSFTDILRVGIEIDRANRESSIKSERCGNAWRAKRSKATGTSAMSARVPAWCRAVKGQPIRIIPERGKIVRQMFKWAARGLGQYAICDRLIAQGVPAWGPIYKGRPPRWTPFYVSAILSSRAVVGEYTPHTKKDGKRVPDGDPVPDYYPAVVPLSLWQKVQDARMAFARSKFGETLHAGRNKFSTANLFRKLVWDVENAVPMVYKQYDGWACLVSTHRKHVREHRIPYRIFEEAMLEYLSTADWKSLSQQEEDPKTTELIERREALAREIDDTTKVLSRYEAILDDPDSTGLDRVVDKYRAAAARSQRLLQERSSLEAEIAAAGNSHAAIAATEGPEFILTERSSPERRLQLRLLIAQRIERIDLVWSPTVLGADKLGLPKKPYAVATVRFRNGASQTVVFPTRESALVLKLGRKTML